MDESLLERGRRFLENYYGGFRIRAYEPVTEYIAESFITPQAAYLTDPSYVVTVVRSSHEDLGEFWPEMPWIFPAEVRLLAAVALAIPEGRGALRFAPYPSNQRLPLSPDESLDAPHVLQFVRSEAESRCRAPGSTKLPYKLASWDFVRSDRLQILDAIDLQDALLLRGLYCLLKGQHLMLHQLFGEEAFINVQIAREAALELVRERLLDLGIRSPSYADAHQYIREQFLLGGHLADFLEDQHERWVATRHPKSRHGTFWTPPLMLDDFLETYAALVSVYRHLILGEPGRLTADLGNEP